MAIDDERHFENDPPEDEEEEEEEEEVDIVDPRDEILENCREGHCVGYKQELETCTERVTSRSSTAETCTQELFDFLHCIDHCATEKVFQNVK